MLRLVMILVLLSTFSTISTARSSSLLKTPVSTCCPPGTFLAIEDWQRSEQDVLGKWILRQDNYDIHGNSPLLALRNFYEFATTDGRHNYISWVYCVPDLNNLPPIDGFAGSSYPHTIVNGTKPLADEQILQSTGARLPSCPGGPNELGTIILGDESSSGFSYSMSSPLLRINSEGKLVGKHWEVFGSTDRMRQQIQIPRPDCVGNQQCETRIPPGVETDLGVDFCLTWSFDPRTKVVLNAPTTTTTARPSRREYYDYDYVESPPTLDLTGKFIGNDSVPLLEAVYCDPCKAKVVCYYLTGNWWAPLGLAKELDSAFWPGREPFSFDHRGGWRDVWIYPLHSYLDADKDGRVTRQEFYDMKTVQILKIFFNGLDVNRDGFVESNEARLESFLRPAFLAGNITGEVFSYLDLNKDGELSMWDVYDSLCVGSNQGFCLFIERRSMPDGTLEENCEYLFYSTEYRRVCKTLVTTFIGPNFEFDDISVTLKDVQTTILRVFKFLARNPSSNHIGLKDLVKGLATLGEPSQVTKSVAQLLTPYVNTFSRMILRSLVKSSDRNSDGGMDWEEFEGFGDFELVFLRWPEMWEMVARSHNSNKDFIGTSSSENMLRYFSKPEVISRLVHNFLFHEDILF